MLKETFQVYQDRLVDLSGRNRSIYLPKLVSTQMVDLTNLDYLNGHPAFHYIEMLIGRKKKIPLIPVTDPRDKNINILSKRLSRLQHLVKLAENETGEKSLFVSWPYVEGKLLNDQLIRCPLMFFPVELIIENDQWQLTLRSSDPPFFNKAFLLAYSHAYGKKIDNEWVENTVEGFSSDPMVFRTEIYQHLQDEFAVNFNQEIFENRLNGFPESTKGADESGFNTGQLKLKPFGVLGQFSQKTSFLVNDYEQLLEGEDLPDLEHLFFKWFANDKEPVVPPREDSMFTIFPMDASQEEVFKAVRSGQSCVVEGPPGTGKSQLISNLVIDYITRGKKVLVVSQKRAALDVVYERLAQLGFDPFLGLVHDFRTDRKALFKKIEQQIQSLEKYQELNRSIDAIQLERQFIQTSRTIDSHVEYFNDFKSGLYNTEECGRPIKELYLNSKLSEDGLEMTQYYREFHWDRVADFLRNFQEYQVCFRDYQKQESFWLHRVDFKDFGSTASKQLQDVLLEIEEVKSGFQSEFESCEDFDISYLFVFFEQKAKLLELIHFLNRPEVLERFELITQTDSREFDLLWLENKFEVVKSLLSEEGVEWHSDDTVVEENFQLALGYSKRSKGWWNSFRLPWKKNKYDPLFELLKNNELNRDKHGLSRLTARLENRLNLNHQYTLLSQKPWLKLPAKPFEFIAFNHSAAIQLDAIRAKLLLKDMGVYGKFLLNNNKDGKSLLLFVDSILKHVGKVEQKINHWSHYLSKIQIQHLITQNIAGGIVALKEQVPFVFDELVAFDQLRDRLSNVDKAVMDKLLDNYPAKDFEELKGLFLSGLRLSWIEHIEAKYPVLKEVSTPKFMTVQKELEEAVVEKGKNSRFIAELKLREKTFQDLKFNRLNNRITYRDLLHQVTKKKKILAIKKLVEEFEDEIFRLVPCWLASPETVSALFPLKQSFDLIVFDESSQCYVERGIPAMLRGKQVVIAGDSNQLQPFDLYQVRIDSEEEGIEMETESLLDLASGYFKKFWLQGHYRSAQLPLIQFSNKRFYENRLNMLTQKDLANSGEIPFELVYVKGIWEKQTNIEEAESVIILIKRIQEQHPEYTIGVITFNFFQMETIQQLVELDANIRSANLSVKNIENVQGDEFDWVIFSIGYAKNKQGKLIANFGLLSKKGGINRLNVAITRSRKKITLVTSLTSNDFSSDQLKNEGVRLLKEYIEFVEQVGKGESVLVEENKSGGFESSWFLSNKLEGTEEGYSLEKYSQSTWMDLVIKRKRKLESAVLTDDRRLYMASGAKEAFVYHPLQLKEKGWPYRFYFSRQYWMGREIVEKHDQEDEAS